MTLVGLRSAVTPRRSCPFGSLPRVHPSHLSHGGGRFDPFPLLPRFVDMLAGEDRCAGSSSSVSSLHRSRRPRPARRRTAVGSGPWRARSCGRSTRPSRASAPGTSVSTSRHRPALRSSPPVRAWSRSPGRSPAPVTSSSPTRGICARRTRSSRRSRCAGARRCEPAKWSAPRVARARVTPEPSSTSACGRATPTSTRWRCSVQPTSPRSCTSHPPPSRPTRSARRASGEACSPGSRTPRGAALHVSAGAVEAGSRAVASAFPLHAAVARGVLDWIVQRARRAPHTRPLPTARAAPIIGSWSSRGSRAARARPAVAPAAGSRPRLPIGRGHVLLVRRARCGLRRTRHRRPHRRRRAPSRRPTSRAAAPGTRTRGRSHRALAGRCGHRGLPHAALRPR